MPDYEVTSKEFTLKILFHLHTLTHIQIAEDELIWLNVDAAKVPRCFDWRDSTAYS